MSFVWKHAPKRGTGVWQGERNDGARFQLCLNANGSIRRIARWINRPMKTGALGFWTTVPSDSLSGRDVARSWKGLS